jgi:DNA-binding NarL/FixJ family response regulator
MVTNSPVLSSAAHTSKSILFIDGDDINRQYYAQRLQAAFPDFHIHEAASGKTGLEQYETYRIDCVILELALPDMSGFQVLVKLVPMAHAPEVPVIVLTQLSSLSLLKIARFNGAQVVLQKATVSGDDLEKAVQRALATVPRDSKKSKHLIL